MSEVDCVEEVENNNDISINFLGNTIDLFFECTPTIEEDFYKYIQDTKNIKNNGLDLFEVDENELEFDENGNLVVDGI